MSAQTKRRIILSTAILITLSLTACNNPTSTPNAPTPVACGAQALIDSIDYANNHAGHDVLNLGNCVYTLRTANNSSSVDGLTVFNGLPEITSEITIQGNNAVIEVQKDPGEPYFGPFFVASNGDLEIYDALIKDGSRPVGGAVINNGGDFFAMNVTFRGNSAFPADNGIPARGGAIYSLGGRVRVIGESLLQENTAGETMTWGPNYGGAIYVKNAILQVTNSSFLWNYAAGDGGAIYAEKGASYEGGGLITLSDDSFNENSALRDGGAVAVVNEDEGVFIAATTFRGGEAGNYGGGVYAEASDVSTNYLEFRFNTAMYGGAVYTKRLGEGQTGQFYGENSEYIGNIASEDGGAVFSENSDLILEDSFLTSNSAQNCGAISHGGSPGLDIYASDFPNIPRIESIFEIIGGLINLNEATGEYGGGLCHMMGDLEMTDTSVIYNTADNSGGGAFIMDESTLTGVSFLANEATYGGGALIGFPVSPDQNIGLLEADYLDFWTRITDANFGANTSSWQGGGIWQHKGGSTIITKSTFGGNTTEFSGGGILHANGDMFISNSTFSGNTAGRGGGLYKWGLSINPLLHIRHSTFTENVATDTEPISPYDTFYGGGGLNINGRVEIYNSIVVNNVNKDCDLNQGLSGSYTHVGNVDSDGYCGFDTTEANPMVGSLSSNGGSTATVALLPGSPLIDTAPDCSNLTDDQRGVPRPLGAACDPGAYEFDPNDPPPPPPPFFDPEVPESSSEPEERSDYCSLFDEMEISTVLLAIPEGSNVMPVYLRMPGGVPGLALEIPDGPEAWNYRLELGDYESYRCELQGFEDRLYCLLEVPPEAPGLVLDLSAYLDGCGNPIFTQPRVTIPLSGGTEGGREGESPTCSADLGPEACEAAGGAYLDLDDPYCLCP